MILLRTDRLQLTNLRRGDGPAVHRYRSDPDCARYQRWNDITPKAIDAYIARHTLRGQYATGTVNGQKVPAYRDEPRVDPQSTTETFVALKLYIDNWRWADVPIYIYTGKRLAEKRSEVSLSTITSCTCISLSRGMKTFAPARSSMGTR